MNRAELNLDAEANDRLREVRKELWVGGLQGLVFGSSLGVAGHVAASKFPLSWKVKLNKNTLLATVLLMGSLGSFIGAVTFGKNAAQYIGDIFALNRSSTSTYQGYMIENEKSLISSFEESYSNREDAIRKSVQNRGLK